MAAFQKNKRKTPHLNIFLVRVEHHKDTILLRYHNLALVPQGIEKGKNALAQLIDTPGAPAKIKSSQTPTQN